MVIQPLAQPAGCSHWLPLRTFVPGETVLSAPSDVGHCQDPSKVSHKQQVSNTGDRQPGRTIKARKRAAGQLSENMTGEVMEKNQNQNNLAVTINPKISAQTCLNTRLFPSWGVFDDLVFFQALTMPTLEAPPAGGDKPSFY